MGMYDTILIPCPVCGFREQAQSKASECTLRTYELFEAPSECIADIAKDSYTCKECLASWDMHVNYSISYTIRR